MCSQFTLVVLIFTTSIIASFSTGNLESERIKWIPGDFSKLRQLKPSGVEGRWTQYVARASHHGFLIPGKVVSFSPGSTYATVAMDGVDMRKRNYEVLIVPNGATSWVESSYKNLPTNSIVAGRDEHTGEKTYICRGLHNGMLLLGKYVRSGNTCIVGTGGKEHYKTHFEILKVNAYGMTIGANVYD